ncbi:unnamed protein product [Paramecium sonneborni]|uniref:Uncharacterized protein n=1 Tax=Paramecium sonneborni TaxID=65129 RepID=A0A8S1RKR3_9CILI|nr:unnamed protein product [Paramecium sonneborni]
MINPIIIQGVYQYRNYLKRDTFQIKNTEKGEQIYQTMDGSIVFIDQNSSSHQFQGSIRNIEQIKYLAWFQKNNQLSEKEKKWIAFWKDEITNIGGLTDENSLKIGKWIEPFENYCEQCLVVMAGEYNQGKKQGIWEIFMEGQMIGLGLYIEGTKIGKQVELFENFQLTAQIIFIGDYLCGQKQGQWDYHYRYLKNKKFQIMQLCTKIISGGGEFDIFGRKVGKWVDLFENFRWEAQVLCIGEYNFGKKIGKWDYSYSVYQNQPYMIIGGGYYDQDGLKRDFWIELFENFQEYCQVIKLGNYKHGIKQGRWDFKFRCYSDEPFQNIGGGEYNLKGQKTGAWIELFEKFQKKAQVIYSGEYKEGIKCGRWKIYFKNFIQTSSYKQIGGGRYMAGIKQDRWIEIHDEFSESQKIIVQKLYNKVGILKDSKEFRLP